MLADNTNSDYDPFADDVRSLRVQAAVLLPGVFLALVVQILALTLGKPGELPTLAREAMRISAVSLGLSLLLLALIVTGSPGWGRRGFGDAYASNRVVLTTSLALLAIGLAGMLFVAVVREYGSTGWGAIVALGMVLIWCRVWGVVGGTPRNTRRS
jgi:hypothetical protein